MSEQSCNNDEKLSEKIEKGHSHLDELHRLLMDLKDQKVEEIIELKGQLEQSKQKLKTVHEQRDAVAKVLNENMCTVVDLRKKVNLHQEEIQERDNQIIKWKNKYHKLYQNLRNLATDTQSDEEDEANSKNEDESNEEKTREVEETGETNAKRSRNDT